MTISRYLFSAALLTLFLGTVAAKSPRKDVQRCGLEYLESNFSTYDALHKRIHGFAEPGYQEYRSSETLAAFLEERDFVLERGVAEIPTAFVATYGSGHPVIGLLAEFDALPGLSQDTVAYRKPLEDRSYGHGCAHNLLGTADVAAGVAIAHFLKNSGLGGTVKVYGCPAEEGGGGKAYMTMAGCFDDCDVIFDWHPDLRNEVSLSPGLANVGAKFTFHGTPAHASDDPWDGRSALDAVQAFNLMIEMMREHIPTDARIHYVITDGGKAPNIVPERAQVYYYFRHPKGSEAKKILERAVKAAEGAALGTGTTMEYELIHGNYEKLVIKSLSEIFQRNLLKVGGLDLDEREKGFLRDIMEASGIRDTEEGLRRFTEVQPSIVPAVPGGSSTDVGSVSQVVPLAQLAVSTTIVGIHSWQQTAIGGTTIGTKALLNVAKVFYLSAVEIYTDPGKLTPIRSEFESIQGPHPEFIPLMGYRKPPLDYRN